MTAKISDVMSLTKSLFMRFIVWAKTAISTGISFIRNLSRTTIVITLVVCAVIPISFLFWQSSETNSSNTKISFNSFPEKYLANPNTKFFTVKINELITTGQISTDTFNVKNGTVLIGVVDGFISLMDPLQRPSDPHQYLNFSISDEEIRGLNGLTEFQMTDGKINFFLNKDFQEKAVYSVVNTDDGFEYSVVTFAILNLPGPVYLGNVPSVISTKKVSVIVAEKKNTATPSTPKKKGFSKLAEKLDTLGKNLKEVETEVAQPFLSWLRRRFKN